MKIWIKFLESLEKRALVFKKKKGASFDTPFFVRVHIAEIGLKFDCDAFMSSADDWFLTLLCRMFPRISELVRY